MNSVKSIPVVDEFLKNWKEKAMEYYLNLRKEYDAERAKKYEINEENLKYLKVYSWSDKRKFSDEKVAEILESIKAGTCAGYRLENLKCEIKYQKVCDWRARHTKSDVNIIERDAEDLERILNRDVEVKKRALISRVEKKAGEILDASGLYIASNGEINGYVIGSLKRVEVETITAGGYNIQVLHYRVLVK